MTTLRPITDPYASVYVATFEPLIVPWLSGLGLGGLRSHLLVRAAEARPEATLRIFGGAAASTLIRFDWQGTPFRAASRAGAPGADLMLASASSRTGIGPRDPMIGRGATTKALPARESRRRRAEIDRIFSFPDLTVDKLIKGLREASIPCVLVPTVREALAPIGLTHLYRQLYFDADAGMGPIEQVIAIAPMETLEIVQEMTRRMSSERIEQFGSETTQENTTETTQLEEISDQVQSSISRDMSVGISASASGSIGVWSVAVNADAKLSTSSQQSREQSRTRLNSITKRSSELVRKSYSLSVRSFSEFSERSSLKRVVKNEGQEPVNYALRRVMRQIRVKVQSLGPRVVWQLYVGQPGAGLAQSRLVMFREADPVSAPGLPPNAPPKPVGGTESASQTVEITSGPAVVITVPKDPAREVTSMVVDSIVDAAPEGKSPSAPGITPDIYQRIEGADRVSFRFSVVPGSAYSTTVQYTLHYEPSAAVLQQWNDQVAAARALFDAEKREAEFERAKRIITEKSRVPARPAADLRREERYEILNRMISEAFHSYPAAGFPGPLEIEIFHRMFDIDAMFYYVHPSWWRPRYTIARESYEITDDSDPAPFGKSLGWLIQLDGDKRRNEFLNSPWLRVCLPIHPGREREACDWLATHIEGARGFDMTPSSLLGALIKDIEARRAKEGLAAPGPDYVTLDGEVAPNRTQAAEAYPVIDEFDVVVPTEGFVYERVELEGNPADA
jgi:hypothetical protein